MKYDGKPLNIVQETRVIETFFDYFFRNREDALESFLNKEMEESDYDFLMYTDQDVEAYIRECEIRIALCKSLLDRDYNTEKFEDSFFKTEKIK